VDLQQQYRFRVDGATIIPARAWIFTCLSQLTLFLSHILTDFKVIGLLSASCTALPKALPTTGNTIKNRFLIQFSQAQDVIKLKLKESYLSVHFSFDLRGSPNHQVFFGIIGYWIDATEELRCV